MLKVNCLKKKYNSRLALKGISFELPEKGVYGLLGPNGAGKSTTMNIISGCIAADDGQVLINGYDIYEESIKAKSCIGYLPEELPLYEDMSVYEYLRFIAKAKRVKKDELLPELEYVVEKTGLKGEIHTLISKLSKGFKQRVGIAQALIGAPLLIILDEPTSGLDARQMVEIRSLIKELGEEHTVIFSSHILHEVQEICDRVIIICEGEIAGEGSVEELCRIGDEHPTLSLTVKCDPMTAMDIVDSLESVTHYAILEGENEGETNMELTLDGDSDIRETLFFAFSHKDIVILSMSVKKQSLEESYMKMTEPACDYELVDDLIPEDAEADTDMNEEEYTPVFEDREKVENDDYTPLFGVGEEDDK